MPVVVSGGSGLQVIVTPNTPEPEILVEPHDSLSVVLGPGYPVVGPQGPPGPSGAGGAPTVHTQSVASANWSVVHNLGYKPLVEILDDLGNVMYPDILQSSNNAYSVIFAEPTTGFALSR